MLLWLLACQSENIQVFTTEEHLDIITFFVEAIEDQRLEVVLSEDPVRSARRYKGWGIALSESNEGITDAYRVSEIREGRQEWLVEGDTLGLQYGLADLLERMNYRFYHPYKSYLPEEIKEPQILEIQEEWQEPEMNRRGLHMHTLHPIEGYYDFWEPSENHLQRAKRVIDWTIKNRGNYIEWVALDNITDNPIAHEAWKTHTQAIIDDVHQRGATVGLGVQLFGSGNLQNAFDLVDDVNGNRDAQLSSRLALVLEDLDFDVLEMSFGEFFDEEPQSFIDSINQAYDVVQSVSPGIEMTSRLHVGDDLQVTYNNQEMIYYFLAAYANPEITPWVHTVMYYNLFEPSNGAYHHADFTEHREFLFERLENGLPVAYFPESAYWVAFDNSVPVYLPMYVRSRWLDMYEIKQQSVANGHDSLVDHTLFSSGWELGYWQNDVATLRMNWSVPDSYLSVFKDLFSNYSNGEELAKALYDFSELQKIAMIDNNLDAYTCGVDNIMELGYSQDIISQPKRLSFRQMLEADLNAIETVQSSFTEYLQGVDQIAFPEAIDAWQEEIANGIQIDIYRAQFMDTLLRAILAHRNNTDASTLLTEAGVILSEAQELVDLMRSKTWDPDGERLFAENTNSTIYQFGYLHRASDLCYWQREMIQATNAITDSNDAPPGCGL